MCPPSACSIFQQRLPGLTAMKKRGRNEEGEVDMVNGLMLLSKVGERCTNPSKERGGFKCKTCNRQFLSFQALGGHRASHKRLKLMSTDLSSRQLSDSTMKPKMHLCPICGLEFAIGQALGGHMRKHRAAMPIHDHARPMYSATKRFHFCLDLNLTPYENHLNLNSGTPVLNQSFL